jgi:hypothetical protein
VKNKTSSHYILCSMMGNDDKEVPMSINILKSYMQICEDIGVEPTWEGLKKFKNKFKEGFYGKCSLCK